VDLLTVTTYWIAFLTLLALEIVLGIDNIVFISILVDKLPEERQALARRLGLGLALVMRIILLLSLSWVIGLTAPLFTVLAQEISGRDVILILGGLFLLGKATYEIHENLEGEEGHSSARVKATFASVLVQIILIDMVFSLDSVITAVGMVDQVSVMIAAVTVAIVVMLFSAEAVAGVVNRHPTLKMLALSFLLLIGLTLLLEGFDQHVPKGYIYFAMGFSVLVELLNIRVRRRREARSHPVELHRRYSREEPRPAPEAGPRPRSVLCERVLPAIAARLCLCPHEGEIGL
jgi:predicted tellurium resistance membrane protein TerC